MKKVIGYIMIVLLFAGSIAGIYFGIKYNGVKNDKANIDTYKQQIEELTNNVKVLTSDIEDLESLVASQEETITGLTGDKAELEATIVSLNETISNLTAQVEEYQSQIDTLNSTIASKDELLEEYSSTIANLQSHIESLNATISNLNNMITYYEELIASYDFAGKSIITFKVKDNVYDVIVAESDETFHYDVTDPLLIGYTFTGWSSDKETTIDLQNTTFPQDTTLYALFEEKTETYTVNSSATIRTTEYTATIVDFNSYIDITGSTVNNVELLTYASPALLDITEPLTNFTTVKDSSIEIVIPMSFISENYPDLLPSIESDTYFKAVYSYFGDEFILTDFDWYIKFNHAEYDYNYSSEITSSEEVKYITSLNSKVYILTKTDMFSRDEYVVTLSENEDGIVLTCEDQELSYTKSTSNMYFVNETIDDTLIQFTFGINEDYTISILWLNNIIDGGNISVTESTGESEEPEEPSYITNVTDYEFSGDTITAYNGDDENISIPTSYSIIDVISEEETFTDQDLLMEFLYTNIIDYPIEIIDSNDNAYTIFSEFEVIENADIIYPARMTVNKNVYGEGNDFQVKKIGIGAFKDKVLKGVIIPDSIIEIGIGAFENCDSLVEINISANVTKINNFVFRFCDNLVTINIDENNPNYTSIDGVLFTKDVTKLIQYPSGKSEKYYMVPEGVTEVGATAFSFCDTIEHIELPSGLKILRTLAFYRLTNLKSITIPASVENIETQAFSSVSSLEYIIFEKATPFDCDYGSNIFMDCNGADIYVPSSAVYDYKSALTSYAERIKPIDELEVA